MKGTIQPWARRPLPARPLVAANGRTVVILKVRERRIGESGPRHDDDVEAGPVLVLTEKFTDKTFRAIPDRCPA